MWQNLNSSYLLFASLFKYSKIQKFRWVARANLGGILSKTEQIEFRGAREILSNTLKKKKKRKISKKQKLTSCN